MYLSPVVTAQAPMIWDFNLSLKAAPLSGTAFKKSYFMNILIFKTNIRYKKDVKAITPVINTIPSVLGWNIDRGDGDKVLRREAADNDIEAIRNKIQYAGYWCEELV